jgi:hypothetical protein
MLIGYKSFQSVGVAVLLILSCGNMVVVTGEEISITISFLKSSIATINSVFSPWSWWSLTTSNEPHDIVEDDPKNMRQPNLMSDMKIVFDSFYEEDYGIADIFKEEEQSPNKQEIIGRLKHQRIRESCDRDDTSQNCGANRSGHGNFNSKW